MERGCRQSHGPDWPWINEKAGACFNDLNPLRLGTTALRSRSRKHPLEQRPIHVRTGEDDGGTVAAQELLVFQQRRQTERAGALGEVVRVGVIRAHGRSE